MRQPDLLSWTPPCQVIVFPMTKRVGRIRDVARKLLGKETERARSSYQSQVTDALVRSFERSGIPEHEQDEHLGAFWSAVEIEVARLTYRGQRPGGDAA